MNTAIQKAKLGNSDKLAAIKNLSFVSQMLEESFEPAPDAFEKALAKERTESWKYGGRTVFGKAKPPKDNGQLSLFD